MEHTLATITNASLTISASTVITATAIAGLIGLSMYVGRKLTLQRTSVNWFKRYKRETN
jgi:hypothetical protein